MLPHDNLISVFQFLDWSYIPTLSVVCSEWNLACNSETLWEFYFALMAGSSWKDLLSKCLKSPKYVQESDDGDGKNIYKKLIRNEFSNLSEIKRNHQDHPSMIVFCPLTDNDTMKMFEDRVLNQLIAFQLGRIRVKGIEFSNFYSNRLTSMFDTRLFGKGVNEVRVNFEIMGIGNFVIRRNCNSTFRRGMLIPNFFMYFTTLEEDKINYQSGQAFDVGTEKSFANATVFRKFEEKYEISGEHVFTNVIKQLVPELKQFGLSANSFAPIWFILFAKLLKWFGYDDEFREGFKYPNKKANRLLRSLKAKPKVSKLISLLKTPTFYKLVRLIEEYDAGLANGNYLASVITDMEYNLPNIVRKLKLYEPKLNASLSQRIENVKKFIHSLKNDNLVDLYINYNTQNLNP